MSEQNENKHSGKVNPGAAGNGGGGRDAGFGSAALMLAEYMDNPAIFQGADIPYIDQDIVWMLAR